RHHRDRQRQLAVQKPQLAHHRARNRGHFCAPIQGQFCTPIDTLMDMLRWQLTSRADFERLQAANADTLTDLERAARFLYLQRTCFGGKITGRNFGVSPGVPARFDVTKLGAVLEEIHERLSAVVIERLPYAEVITRYDRPDTLFYLDPPYWGCERDYGPGVFDPADFARLADQLAGIQGKFVMSLNDEPGVREVFGRFHIEGIETTYTISGTGQDAAEVLISNVEPVAFGLFGVEG
ncbi:DNA adenine methylase, partial [Roseomonas haemaphysalidis]